MSRKNYEAVLNHLLFHKALISDGDEKINEYIDIVKNMEEGSLASAEDPVDKCIVIVFDLVLKNKFDPWSIDLVEFCKLYLKRIRKEDDINFIIAGHIVHLAWSILKLQSKDVLFNADKEEEYYFQDWDVDEIYENPEDIDYIEKSRTQFFAEAKGLESISITSDPSITRGGCFLETCYGDIDASVETRLEKVYQSLEQARGD